MSSGRSNVVFAVLALVLGTLLGVVACSSSKAAAEAAGPSALVAPPTDVSSSTRPAQLWGDMRPVVSVKELMRDLIDPLADNIFDGIAIVNDGRTTVEHLPKTDEDWARIRIGAVAMAEGAYLLKIRRPFAPAGDENNSQGPDAVELSPAAITAKVEKDPVEWNARIEALRNVGLEVLDIVNRKAVNELWDASEDLDQACEACHRSYWYPGETLEYYKKLDDRLKEFSTSTTTRPSRTTRR